MVCAVEGKIMEFTMITPCIFETLCSVYEILLETELFEIVCMLGSKDAYGKTKWNGVTVSWLYWHDFESKGTISQTVLSLGTRSS